MAWLTTWADRLKTREQTVYKETRSITVTRTRLRRVPDHRITRPISDAFVLVHFLGRSVIELRWGIQEVRAPEP